MWDASELSQGRTHPVLSLNEGGNHIKAAAVPAWTGAGHSAGKGRAGLEQIALRSGELWNDKYEVQG